MNAGPDCRFRMWISTGCLGTLRVAWRRHWHHPARAVRPRAGRAGAGQRALMLIAVAIGAGWPLKAKAWERATASAICGWAPAQAPAAQGL